jgi:hypothetical protein
MALAAVVVELAGLGRNFLFDLENSSDYKLISRLLASLPIDSHLERRNRYAVRASIALCAQPATASLPQTLQPRQGDTMWVGSSIPFPHLTLFLSRP